MYLILPVPVGKGEPALKIKDKILNSISCYYFEEKNSNR